LRDFVQRQEGAKCSGAKIEKKAGLARHFGYWITVGFQGFGHFFLVGIDGRSSGLREVWILFSLKDATAERGDAGMGRIAHPNCTKCAGLKHGSAYTRDELSAMSNAGK
jgi:hypothetical protein